MQVPNKLVGSILGKGGSTLKEIQQQTGARVTISKRGEFAPGTQNRCVLVIEFWLVEEKLVGLDQQIEKKHR